ncbi:unnamed protein product [Pedinophyceae sp. YPF-701]|nr:unnamed protein product [Pedinophyceae sp. YPF-701]
MVARWATRPLWGGAAAVLLALLVYLGAADGQLLGPAWLPGLLEGDEASCQSFLAARGITALANAAGGADATWSGRATIKAWKQAQGIQPGTLYVPGTNAANLPAGSRLLEQLEDALSALDGAVAAAAPACNAACQASQRQALQALFAATGGPTWADQGMRRIWQSDVHHCCWPGVECCGSDGTLPVFLRVGPNVVGLVDSGPLRCLRPGAVSGVRVVRQQTCARGDVHRHAAAAANALPDAAVRDLATGLEALDLSGMCITGSMPAALADAVLLRLLDLSHNDFTGEVPGQSGDGWGDHQFLTEASLHVNGFSGTFPGTFADALRLAHLNVRGNRLAVTPSGLALLPLLSDLDISNNQVAVTVSDLEGAFVANGPFADVQDILRSRAVTHKSFTVRDNLISGAISSSFFTIPLREIDAGNNRLTGSIPAAMARLSTLKSFAIDNNNIEGTLPDPLAPEGLATLTLSNNALLTGTIPPSLTESQFLTDIDLSGTRIFGAIPRELGDLPGLILLDLRDTLMTHNASDRNSRGELLPESLAFAGADGETHGEADDVRLVCPLVRPRRLMDTETRDTVRVRLSPVYYRFEGCACSEGFRPQRTALSAAMRAAFDAVTAPDADSGWGAGTGAAAWARDFLPTDRVVCVGESSSALSNDTIIAIVASVVGSLLLVLLVLFAFVFRHSLQAALLDRRKRAGPPRGGKETTMLLTDVEDSTLMWETRPREMSLANALHDAIIRKHLSRWHGYEVTTEGDSFLLAFHDPVDALGYAIAVQQALATADWPDCMVSTRMPHASVGTGRLARSDPADVNGVRDTLAPTSTKSAAEAVISDAVRETSIIKLSSDPNAARKPSQGPEDGDADARAVAKQPASTPRPAMASKTRKRLLSVTKYSVGFAEPKKSGGDDDDDDDSGDDSGDDEQEGSDASEGEAAQRRTPPPRAVRIAPAAPAKPAMASISPAAAAALTGGGPLEDDGGDRFFRGLRVRMSISTAHSDPAVTHRMTRRLEYSGAVYTLVHAIQEVTHGGQVLMDERSYEACLPHLTQIWGQLQELGANKQLSAHADRKWGSEARTGARVSERQSRWWHKGSFRVRNLTETQEFTNGNGKAATHSMGGTASLRHNTGTDAGGAGLSMTGRFQNASARVHPAPVPRQTSKRGKLGPGDGAAIGSNKASSGGDSKRVPRISEDHRSIGPGGLMVDSRQPSATSITGSRRGVDPAKSSNLDAKASGNGLDLTQSLPGLNLAPHSRASQGEVDGQGLFFGGAFGNFLHKVVQALRGSDTGTDREREAQHFLQNGRVAQPTGQRERPGLVVLDMGQHALKGLPHATHLYQPLVPFLEERARFFPPLPSDTLVTPGYFDAPGALAPLFPSLNPCRHGPPYASCGECHTLAETFPQVTILFCAPVKLDELFKEDRTAANAAMLLYKAVVRRTLPRFNGYECQELSGCFMVAFHTMQEALMWGLALQLSLPTLPWSPRLLKTREAAIETNAHGLVTNCGLRVRIGACEGVPIRIIPHIATGRADYFGPLVNRAARICFAAAHSGEVVGPADMVAAAFVELCAEGIDGGFFSSTATRRHHLQQWSDSHNSAVGSGGAAHLQRHSTFLSNPSMVSRAAVYDKTCVPNVVALNEDLLENLCDVDPDEFDVGGYGRDTQSARPMYAGPTYRTVSLERRQGEGPSAPANGLQPPSASTSRRTVMSGPSNRSALTNASRRTGMSGVSKRSAASGPSVRSVFSSVSRRTDVSDNNRFAFGGPTFRASLRARSRTDAGAGEKGAERRAASPLAGNRDGGNSRLFAGASRSVITTRTAAALNPDSIAQAAAGRFLMEVPTGTRASVNADPTSPSGQAVPLKVAWGADREAPAQRERDVHAPDAAAEDYRHMPFRVSHIGYADPPPAAPPQQQAAPPQFAEFRMNQPSSHQLAKRFKHARWLWLEATEKIMVDHVGRYRLKGVTGEFELACVRPAFRAPRSTTKLDTKKSRCLVPPMGNILTALVRTPVAELHVEGQRPLVQSYGAAAADAPGAGTGAEASKPAPRRGPTGVKDLGANVMKYVSRKFGHDNNNAPVTEAQLTQAGSMRHSVRSSVAELPLAGGAMGPDDEYDDDYYDEPASPRRMLAHAKTAGRLGAPVTRIAAAGPQRSLRVFGHGGGLEPGQGSGDLSNRVVPFTSDSGGAPSRGETGGQERLRTPPGYRTNRLINVPTSVMETREGEDADLSEYPASRGVSRVRDVADDDDEDDDGEAGGDAPHAQRDVEVESFEGSSVAGSVGFAVSARASERRASATEDLDRRLTLDADITGHNEGEADASGTPETREGDEQAGGGAAAAR